MHERGKSDRSVVPTKPPNNVAGRPARAEAVEGRELAKGNAAGKTRPGHSAGKGVPRALDRVRQAAGRDKQERFTALLHHVDVDRLRAAYRGIKPRAAAGVDGVTWRDYGADLEANLRDLCDRVHRGSYRAKPARRAYIDKTDGRLRPLGIAALEDKIVQRAVAEVLQAVYEADFLGFSYGFRPGRGQHHALDALAAGITRKKVNWVLDADIRNFFPSLDRGWLEKFLEHRIADPRILRLYRKWVNAGIVEDGQWSDTGQGTEQGAAISPLLGNVYLHYVFDTWAHWWRRHARGDVVIVRFADDIVVGFEHERDARRFWADLRARLARFNLELAEDKTRLIEFGRFAARNRARRGLGKPETFTFLGFVHICATSRNGKFWLRRITHAKRMRAKLRELKDELKRRRHLPIAEQGRWLASVVRGHLNYYAVPGNSEAIRAFRQQLTRHWFKALRRRSQRHQLTWKRMGRIAAHWLPPARIRHPWPLERFDARPKAGAP